MATKTNAESKFTSFTLDLPTGDQVTGISYIPTTPTPKGKGRPLIVGVHGGTCTAQNYDITPEYTASIYAEAHAAPFVAIDRPCYGGSTSFLPLSPDGPSFHEETATWLHSHIFPALWTRFGLPNGCAAIIPTAHSMGVASTVIVASRHASEQTHVYPLGGIIISGLGFVGHASQRPELAPPVSAAAASGQIIYPSDVKHKIMLSDPALGLGHPDLYPLVAKQTVPMPVEEFESLRDRWADISAEIVPGIKAPVLWAVGEMDWLWEGTEEHAEEVKGFFSGARMVDVRIVPDAPHAIEWSHKAKEWGELSFGWAVERAGEMEE